MCNLYRPRQSVDEIRQVFGKDLLDSTGNKAWPSLTYPNRQAPIIRHGADGELEIAQAAWGMPTPPQYLRTERDPGVTNVRNTRSTHWRRWLGPDCRCLVPLTAFNEGQWFEPKEPMVMFFAGIETRAWRSVRRVKDGPTEDDLYAFLTTEASPEVAEIHEKAMPVILTDEADWTAWLTLPWEKVADLQRPLPAGTLHTVDRVTDGAD